MLAFDDHRQDPAAWARTLGISRLGGRLYSQVDLPRVREAQIAGCVWSITTNPFRRAGRRAGMLAKNLDRLQEVLARCPDDVAVCRDATDYRRARAEGKHAAFLGVQGGNALDADGALDGAVLDELIRVTLVHLSTSSLGGNFLRALADLRPG